MRQHTIAYVLEYKFHVLSCSTSHKKIIFRKVRKYFDKNWILVHSPKIVKQTCIDHMWKSAYNKRIYFNNIENEKAQKYLITHVIMNTMMPSFCCLGLAQPNKHLH